MAEQIIRKRVIEGEEIDVIYRHSVPLEDINTIPGGWGYYSPMNQRTYEENGIICEQDVAITLSDGVTIYADIYRPVGATNIPCIMAWSIYGKRPHDMPRPWATYGVPAEAISDGTKFEGPDPYYWCHYGYAVANVDPRGCGHSEGEMPIWGDTEAKDGAEVIEWLAACEWCNGKVGMAGNSMLAMMQWYIAAEQPPHLAAIAPWEGCSDILREFMCEGGIPAIGFNTFVYKDLGSESPEGLMEDIPAMAVKYPDMNPYWRSKIAKFEKIEVPAYIAAGMSHLHMRGTINAYRKMASKQKWLRIHREFEWPDAYSYEMKEDLRKFFDRYLKGIYNGWELTPKVRLDVMDAYDCDIQKQRPEADFPIPRTVYKKLYLDANKKSLSYDASFEHTRTSYDAETGEVCFDITFEEDTEITGLMKLRLWVEAEGHDDMDMFITVQKLDEKGNFLPTWVFGERHPGAWGKMRVSRRHQDPDLATDIQPVQSMTKTEKLAPGEIVPVDIEIYPYSRFWHKGQQLRVRVAGRYIRDPWFEPFSWDTDNKGQHVIHTGGTYDSYLQIPVIPPKYKAGEYVYR